MMPPTDEALAEAARANSAPPPDDRYERIFEHIEECAARGWAVKASRVEREVGIDRHAAGKILRAFGDAGVLELWGSDEGTHTRRIWLVNEEVVG